MSFELRGIEVQTRIRSQRRDDTLVFGFTIGPQAVSCICNLPNDRGEWENQPLVRIKVSLKPEYDWKAFGEQKVQIRSTAEGSAIIFGFQFSPIAIFCIANLPEKEGEFKDSPLVYVKLSITPDNEWKIFREHFPGIDGSSLVRSG